MLGICLITHGWFVLESTPNLLNPSTLERILQQLGFTGPLICIGVLVLSVVISPIPGAPLAVVGGVVWGMPWAGIYSVIVGFLGSLLAYFIGRTLGHSAIQALTGKSIYIVNQRGDRYLGWLIFFSRLFPVLPFDLVSYAAGITRLSV
ncbi:MAG: TVP38/TMEM64 family protein, partial [Okeania sp. SIO2G5]|nr:TVP38/TMEM64 family protein [Okeania sp. SIO2G5]